MSETKSQLNARESLRYGAAVLALEGKITRTEAAWRMGVSPRQAYRIVARVKTQGAKGVVHALKGRAPHNKTPDSPPLPEVFRRLRTKSIAPEQVADLARQLGCEPQKLRGMLARIRI